MLANAQQGLGIQIPEGFPTPLSCYPSATFRKTSENLWSVIFFQNYVFQMDQEVTEMLG